MMKLIIPINSSSFNGGAVCTTKLFYNLHGVLPSKFKFDKIDTQKIEKILESKHLTIEESILREEYDGAKDKTVVEEKNLILKNGMIVRVFSDDNRAQILYSKKLRHHPQPLIDAFTKLRVQQNSRIYLVTNRAQDLSLVDAELAPQELDISLNYGYKFVKISEEIEKNLSIHNSKGLFLFHGPPGTGKSSYIRYLASRVEKDFIYIPSNIASALTGPSLIEMMMDNRNSVLIIEDAERILLDRNKGGDGVVSSILNLSDGLLSDCLNIQIICTFNTNLKNVDEALLRKGRLIASPRFDLLSPEQASKLSNHLGHEKSYEKAVPLAEVYSPSKIQNDLELHIQGIGFRN